MKVNATVTQLASCLINAQPLPAHRLLQTTTSWLAAQGHDLTDDWSLASTHFVTAYAHFGARLGAFFYWTRSFETMYHSTIPLRFIWSICSGN